MKTIKAFAAKTANAPLVPFEITRRDAGPNDIQIKIDYCGICHSDLHQVADDWGGSIYPMVPGHEIIGRIVNVGKKVKKFKIGDSVGVGCFVDSCRKCVSCKQGLQQYCTEGFVGTYNSYEKDRVTVTYGGYSSEIVVDQNYVLKIPKNLNMAGAAPLLCAGITTYSPLCHWKIKKGKKVGVIGLGGLGHMGIKLARKMGAEVSLFTTSESKAKDAKRLGARRVILSKDKNQMDAFKNEFDLILDTVSGPHDLNPYITTLKRDGTLVLLGLPEKNPEIEAFNLVLGRRSVAGSLIGGIRETQEMLNFCGKHKITSDVEVIKPDKINQAYERLKLSDVKYRFVIDLRDRL
ncbi:MAG: hydroxyacid dehydrogenase [Proteobacteria bacterium SG_bin7]|nr:MAG: hydroxyacid dehydrogenase [Proteobacteria bacterium SG_bin7]